MRKGRRVVLMLHLLKRETKKKGNKRTTKKNTGPRRRLRLHVKWNNVLQWAKMMPKNGRRGIQRNKQTKNKQSVKSCG